MEKQPKYFGIDLGTTFSCIAGFDPVTLEQKVFVNDSALNTNPSVVNFPSDGGKYLVGYAAKDSFNEGDIIVEEVKRKMDNPLDPANIVKANGKEYNPVAISAMILKYMASLVDAANGGPIDGVVITCPAYFNDVQRANTKKAGEAAGLNVLSIINEPTAAAISYIMKQPVGTDKNYLVYDLGGGTFDITAVNAKVTEENGKSHWKVQVITTDGDAHLGGKDWDAEVQKMILEQIEANTGVSEDTVRNDPQGNFDLIKLSEAMKIDLSARETTKRTFAVPTASIIPITLTRADFEARTKALFSRTLTLLDKVLDTLKAKGVKVDSVLLVGGSSKMPIVKETLLKYAPLQGAEVFFNDPDQAVARGAAIFAYGFAEETEDGKGGPGTGSGGKRGGNGPVEIVEALPKSYATKILDVKAQKEVLSNILLKDTSFKPSEGLRRSDIFHPIEDNQGAVKIDLYENTSTEKKVEVSEGKMLYDFDFKLPPETPATTDITIEYYIDSSSIIYITVSENFKGTKFTTEGITLPGGLNAQQTKDLKALVKDS